MTTSTGRLEAIWIKRAKRGSMDSRTRVRTVAGQGLEGNADQKPHRQVTLLSADQWDEVRRELGADLGPELRRANLLVRGVDLRQSRGKTLRIGGCRIVIHGETRPCRLLDDALPGLQKALDPEWRGGAYGEVLDDAEIAVGDEVSWEPPATS
jgi:MOSC domain-containing protein YiiM